MCVRRVRALGGHHSKFIGGRETRRNLSLRFPDISTDCWHPTFCRDHDPLRSAPHVDLYTYPAVDMLAGRWRKHRLRRSPDQSWTPMMPNMKKTKKHNMRTLPSIGSVSSSSVTSIRIPSATKQEAQLPQRNSVSATHVFLGWLTHREIHWTRQPLYSYIHRVRKKEATVFYA